MGEWEFVKRRTAADGAVWRSWDGQSYKRTGGPAVRDEADFQLHLDDLGYPVPRIIDRGVKGDLHYFVERSAGVSLHAQGMLDEATDAYVQAIWLKPDHAEAHSNLGNALKDNGQLDEAIAAYRQAVRLKPD